MSNPSFINIDQWLFEWKEGNLSPKQIEQLELFLLNNPELDIDKDMWQIAYVDSTPVTYPNQYSLIKKSPVGWYLLSGAASIVLFSTCIYLLYATLSQNTNNDFNTSPLSIRSEGAIQHRSLKHAESQLKSFSYNKYHSESSQGLGEAQQKEFINEFIPQKNKVENLYTNYNSFNQEKRLTSSKPVLSQKLKHETIDFIREERFLLTNNHPNKELQTIHLNLKKIQVGSINNKSDQTLARPLKEIATIEEWTLSRKSASSSKSTFKSTWNNLERVVKRMADNPVALKNLKDPHYHVPGMLANDLNFSTVGTILATRIQASSRYQWQGQTNEQFQNQLFIDGYAYPLRAGIGIQINQSMYYRNGIQNTSVAITYSPKLSLTRNITIEPGFRFKMGTKRIDTTQLSTGQMVEFDRGNPQNFYSATEKPLGESLWYKDLGLSLMANTKWFYLGFQADNIARHYDNIYGVNSNQRAYLHSIITLGTDYESQNHKFGYSPYIVYQNYGKLSEAWLGSNARFNWLTIGAAVSSNYEPAASVGFKFDHFTFNYNIDYTKAISNNKQSLSHQLTLRFLTKPSRVGQRLLNYM